MGRYTGLIDWILGVLVVPDIPKMEAGHDDQGLIRALRHSSPDVRRDAASALGRLSCSLAIQPLITAMSDSNSGVRGAAVEALDRIGDAPRVVEPLITALSDSDSWVRKVAVEALGRIGDAPRVVEPLITALSDSDFWVRKAAVRALDRIGDARALEPLITALSDSDFLVRQAAVEALGRIGDARAVAPLTRVLAESEGQEAWNVVRSLKLINDSRSELVLQVLSKLERDIPYESLLFSNLPEALACVEAGKHFRVMLGPSSGHYEEIANSYDPRPDNYVEWVEDPPTSCEIICCEADRPSPGGAPIAPAEGKWNDA